MFGTYKGTAGDDRFTGSNRADVFDLRAGGSDTVYGLKNGDRFLFGETFGQGDHVDGGSGYDEVRLDGIVSGLTITAGMMLAVERVEFYATGDSDLVIGGDLRPDEGWRLCVAVGAPSDAVRIRVDASASADAMLFVAGGGSDTMIGGSGNDDFDWYVGGDDVFDGGAGTDFFNLAGFSGESLEGAELDLRRSGAQALAEGSITLTNVESLGGTRGDDALTGSSSANRIETNGGNDTVRGLAGDDLIGFSFGGGIVPEAPTTSPLDGGAGFDVLYFNWTQGVDVSLARTDLQDTNSGRYMISGFEAVSASTWNDRVVGSSRSDQLFGNSGDDMLAGGRGEDFLYGDASVAPELDADGHWLIRRDLPYQSGRDTLDGGAGRDRLHGEAGDDVLTGGLGADLLTGGGNADRFVLRSLAESSVRRADTITDFEQGDRIDLSKIDADPVAAGDQAFHIGGTPRRAGDLVITYDEGRNRTVVTIFADGDDVADAAIFLSGPVDLTAADFVL